MVPMENIFCVASLVLVGEPGSATEGLGSVVLAMQSIEFESLPGDLISEIEVDMALIDTPDSLIHVADLVAPEGVTLLVDEGAVVARFQYTQTEEAAETEELETASVEDVEVTEQGEEEAAEEE